MTDAAPLAGRTMVVTGASSGIGRGIALAAARAGADLMLTYRSNKAGARLTAADVADTMTKVPLSVSGGGREVGAIRPAF